MAGHKRATVRSLWWKYQLESFRHCGRCGKKLIRKFVANEGRRRHVCQSCEAITYLNPKIVAGLIPVTSEGKIVLLKRNIEPGFGRWTFPAGYQEMAESVEDAAKRETQEEVNLRVSKIRFLGIYSYADAGVVTIVYVGRMAKKSKPKPGVEAIQTQLFSWKEIPWKDLAFRSTRDALRDFKKFIKPA